MNEALNYSGQNALYWSRSSYNTSRAFYLYFNDTDVGPSSDYSRYQGRSLRCLYPHVK